MEKGSVVIIFIFLIIFCFIVYDSIPSKYAKLEESFGGFMNRSLVRFEYEKSPLHTIVYGGTGTGKTYFVRQYLKLYSVQNQDPRSGYTDQNQSPNSKSRSKSKSKSRSRSKSKSRSRSKSKSKSKSRSKSAKQFH